MMMLQENVNDEKALLTCTLGGTPENAIANAVRTAKSARSAIARAGVIAGVSLPPFAAA